MGLWIRINLGWPMPYKREKKLFNPFLTLTACMPRSVSESVVYVTVKALKESRPVAGWTRPGNCLLVQGSTLATSMAIRPCKPSSAIRIPRRFMELGLW
jgi:hypothetical protein